ncbi:PD40 domain-containing protein [Nocardioides sp. zg-DK7169]|uniref:PD40 domain-containing protein n=1 Tax=Nocardioides sp. zg-DK7169 TaxID=2736600 RepID=UPI0015574B63|nr:PD40 domain-containing protein [Nocardioides sp. zg-DK7169]NPC97928.1 hypothetical protein [Nocardioides sp. zg-DK7169]
MSLRGRVLVMAGVLVLVCGASAAYLVHDAERYRQRHDAAPAVAVAARAGLPDGPRIVFRHTGTDRSFGLVAGVPLADPGGERSISDVACDRVDAVGEVVSCLHTVRGVVTRHELRELDAALRERHTVSLPGIPSRTRLSPDGGLVATTTFVSGHSYLQTGFSTATEIRDVGGEGHGNLERFALVLDGEEVRPADRNLWGVTFLDDRTFYATAATGGRTHLVRGDLEARTLTGLRENAECPALSPDGTRLVYKVDGPEPGTQWSFAVLDLASGEETVLGGQPPGVDDQAAWLDDDTILYGLPREDEPGVTDVWALDTTAEATPRLLIEQAWSPAVVR